MNKTSKLLSILFLIGGLGIIIAVYFLFLKNVQETNLFYLNLIATCLVYGIVLLRVSDIFGSVERVAKAGSGYGLKWLGVWLYTPLALALIVFSIILGLGFNLCIIGHIILLFGLLVFFFLGSLTKNNVNEVIDKIDARKSGLKEISAQIDVLEMQNKLNNGALYQDAIDKLRENVRYITGSDKPAAVELENKLIEKIRLIASQIEHDSQTAEVINEEFQDCMKIIELRKKQY